MLEWRENGELVGTYGGGMSGGRLDGYGSLKVAAEGGGFETLEGVFRNGEIDGEGLYEDANGNIYDGEFKDGKPDGSGYVSFEGEEYAGTFVPACAKASASSYRMRTAISANSPTTSPTAPVFWKTPPAGARMASSRTASRAVSVPT